MSEWQFYENVFQVSEEMLKCYALPYALRKLIIEMDEALRKWRADREEHGDEDLNSKVHDYRRIDSRNLDEIYGIYRDRPVERDRYLEVFPKYKKGSLDIIAALKKERKELRESLESYVDNPNAVANAAGALSGGLRLLSLVTSFSPGLSLLMNASSVTHGAIKTVTTVAEQGINECYLNEAVKLIGQHKKNFEGMSRWFTYDHCLTESIKTAIGSDIAKALFEVFKEVYNKLKKIKEDHPIAVNATKIIAEISKIFINADFGVMVAYSVGTALFQIFWLHYASYWVTDWGIGARHFERMKTLSVAGMYGVHTFLSWQRMFDPSNAFYSTNTIAASVGIAIDLIPPLLDAKKKKSAVRDQEKRNIVNVIEKLEREVNLFQEVYNTLSIERERSLGE